MNSKVNLNPCKALLRRADIIKSRSEIRFLFQNKRSREVGCLQLLHAENFLKSRTKVVFSVPKSKIQKAYLRNKIKRRMREAFRLHRHKLNLYGKLDNMLLGFVFIKDVECKYSTIEANVCDLIDWVLNQIKSKE